MISRREMVTAGVLGTLATGGSAEAAELQQEVQTLRAGFDALASTLNDIKTSLDEGLRGNSMNYAGVGNVKTKIEQYTKVTGRFPDYCDIGLGVFYDVYGWHVRNQQQINITRIAEQRMAIQFMFTQLVLRIETESNYISVPYDR
jgi:hypothetical protein